MNAFQFFISNTIRWHGIYRIAQRPDINALFHSVAANCSAGAVQVFIPAFIEFKSKDGAEGAQVANGQVARGKVCQQGIVELSDALNGLLTFLGLQKLQAGHSRSAGQGIGGEGMSVEECF